MAIDNMISVEFTEQELTRLGNALNEIAQLLSGKVINLTPEERKQYGSIADKNKIFIDKCKAYNGAEYRHPAQDHRQTRV